ncbi:toll/interleukin-1 receptor domain-containing protein [Mesorhizobium sp. M8A.F.Ca.ET.207.01.1.1]|uniref:restriction endonuclease n=1 Tax=Mesorhizobium sp. M8A.F.Ca.ET.207.01.1.1 TaxID=2563968 RepID=UPI00109C6660|nr:restriction endonuclease [Mesorhizobium sp. M8A.F.Ca.ET.207.01.1.1]TGQ80243.1 toll/interleukin-1 receptor domain-containing protein [Mesorhizobium sp. M8A.F.Ca.ET.207.01.1.1]
MNSVIRTCFISAPAGVKLDVLRQALASRGIEVLVPDGLGEGADISAEINSLLARADLVIGVLTTERRSAWVLFELGMAWANKRRIMLIASSSKSDFIPSNLQRLLVIRSKVNNAEAIGFALDQLLAAPATDTREPSTKRALPTGPVSDAFVVAQQVRDAVQTRNGSALERLVAEALQKSGVQVIVEPPRPDQGADMAIWSDVLEPVTGNPLLIEIKTRLSSPSEARTAATNLSKQLAASGTPWGLLLYGEGIEPSAKISSNLPPNILAIDLVTLFERMTHQAFEEVVKDLRNKKVHGSYP